MFATFAKFVKSSVQEVKFFNVWIVIQKKGKKVTFHLVETSIFTKCGENCCFFSRKKHSHKIAFCQQIKIDEWFWKLRSIWRKNNNVFWFLQQFLLMSRQIYANILTGWPILFFFSYQSWKCDISSGLVHLLLLTVKMLLNFEIAGCLTIYHLN